MKVNITLPSANCIYKVALLVNSTIKNNTDCHKHEFTNILHSELHSVDQTICPSNSNIEQHLDSLHQNNGFLNKCQVIFNFEFMFVFIYSQLDILFFFLWNLFTYFLYHIIFCRIIILLFILSTSMQDVTLYASQSMINFMQYVRKSTLLQLINVVKLRNHYLTVIMMIESRIITITKGI